MTRARIEFGLPQPGAQRLQRDAQLQRDGGFGRATATHEADRFRTKLGGVGRMTLRHGIPALGTIRSKRTGLHSTGSTSLYVLVTNDDTLDDEQLLAYTKGRDRVEKRIGIFKGPLAVRPMYLEKVERIRAMVFICLVALLI
jgi:hypothetical protein